MVLFQKMGAKSWERTGPTLWLISLSLPSPDLSKFKPEKKKKKNNNNNKSSSFIIPSRSHEQSNLNKATWDVGLWLPEKLGKPPPPSSKKNTEFFIFPIMVYGSWCALTTSPTAIHYCLPETSRNTRTRYFRSRIHVGQQIGIRQIKGGGGGSEALIVVLNVPCQPLLIGSAHCTIHTLTETYGVEFKLLNTARN